MLSLGDMKAEAACRLEKCGDDCVWRKGGCCLAGMVRVEDSERCLFGKFLVDDDVWDIFRALAGGCSESRWIETDWAPVVDGRLGVEVAGCVVLLFGWDLVFGGDESAALDDGFTSSSTRERLIGGAVGPVLRRGVLLLLTLLLLFWVDCGYIADDGPLIPAFVYVVGSVVAE